MKVILQVIFFITLFVLVTGLCILNIIKEKIEVKRRRNDTKRNRRM